MIGDDKMTRHSMQTTRFATMLNKTVVLLLITLSLTSCKVEHKAPVLDAVNYDQLNNIMLKNDDVLYVVNFWATWCKPCMEELPHFLEVNDENASNKNFKMILVSLDKSDNLRHGVQAVVNSMDIKTDVYLLDDAKRMNEWIPAINENWSGSIPATAFYKNGKQLDFHEGQLSKSELQELIKNNL